MHTKQKRKDVTGKPGRSSRKKVVVGPIVVGALRTGSKNLEKYLEQMGAAIRVEDLQET